MGKFITGLILILLVAIFPVQPASADSTISYYFNGQANEETAEKLFIQNNRTMVPLRAIFEELGANVRWIQETREVYASKGNIHLSMPVDGTTVYRNGEASTIDQSPVMKNNRVFVPLRFVSQAFNADVRWDQATRSVYITSAETIDGETESEQMEENKTKNMKAADAPGFEWMPFWPGDAADKTDDFGEADRIVKSQYDFDWSIYINDYNNYVQAGKKDGIIEGVFAAVPENGSVSLKRGDVLSDFGDPERWMVKNGLYYDYSSDSTWDMFEMADSYLTVFYDHWMDSKVTAVFAISKDMEQSADGFYGNVSDDVRESYEEQLMHITNIERARHGADALTPHDKAAAAARLHSDDMAANNFFAHENLDGKSPYDRLRDQEVLFKTAGENLARRQMGPFHALYNLLDSDGHRQNLLQDNFKQVGTGVSFDGKEPYFTQKFVTEYDF